MADALLLTVIHTGTRSVKAYLNGQGLRIMNFHMVPAGWRYVGKHCTRQITTVRNPYKVAASWMNNSGGNRFEINDWEAQWTLWHKAITEYNFEVIVIENFHEPIVGKDLNPKKVEVPLDKVQFAMNIIKHSGIHTPKYGAD